MRLVAHRVDRTPRGLVLHCRRSVVEDAARADWREVARHLRRALGWATAALVLIYHERKDAGLCVHSGCDRPRSARSSVRCDYHLALVAGPACRRVAEACAGRAGA